MTGPVPVVALAACDALSRDVVASGLLIDSDRTALLVYDHRFEGDQLQLQRRLIDTSGVVYADRVDGDDSCACCRFRQDLPGALDAVSGNGRWDRLVLAAPLASPIRDVAAQLHALTGPASGFAPGPVVAAVDAGRLIENLFGDDLLDERGSALSPHDRRSVGEAVVEHVDYADLVVGANLSNGPAAAVIDQLAGERWLTDWTELDPGTVFARRHDPERARRRTDPLQVEPGRRSRSPHPGVWTLDLRSPRPVHPGRLMERLSDLGTGRIRARGYVWLPSRPDLPCAWDASGGQLSIGSLSGWGSRTPSTRLVITGVDEAERERIAGAFQDVICRPGESADLAAWTTRPDGFEPWLGQTV